MMETTLTPIPWKYHILGNRRQHLQGISKMSRVISGKVRVVYTATKVKDQFRLKDATEDQLATNVVYSFKCLSDSGIQYIGYTNRALKVRVDEHLRGGTRVSDHIANCKGCNDHGVNYQSFTMLKKCRTMWDTAVYEALLIKRHNPVLNKQLVKPGYTHYLKIFNWVLCALGAIFSPTVAVYSLLRFANLIFALFSTYLARACSHCPHAVD